MEDLELVDLQTQDPIFMPYSSAYLLVFCTLNDILLLKELNKDNNSSLVQIIGIYIGKENKKMHLWKTKEPNIFPIYFGGPSPKPFAKFNLKELPSFSVILNSEVLISSPFSLYGKPLFKTLLDQFPNLKKPTLIELLESSEMPDEQIRTTEERFESLEKTTNEGTVAIENLRKDLAAKDRMINEILSKIERFEESRKNGRRIVDQTIYSDERFGDNWKYTEQTSDDYYLPEKPIWDEPLPDSYKSPQIPDKKAKSQAQRINRAK